ncbi:MAG: purine-nucleoside phosphorylase [Deltaproteobacteria bacterium]|nr:purine-nucleoside phosphorylase [Deltaproteobacteria bacterium]
MRTYRQQVEEAAYFIQDIIGQKPAVGLLTGTGLGDSAKSLSVSNTISYAEIPNFPEATAPGHAGKLLFGSLSQHPCLVMQGRFHLYEGYTPLEVALPIRMMQTLGVQTLFITNAAGGLNPVLTPGDIMIIKDHINLSGANPLIGPNYDDWGDRFPDMSAVYDPGLILAAQDAGWTLGIPIQTGIYAGLRGPSLETPAEVRYLSTIGAEAVGFSTIQEVIAAGHAGMQILGLSIITNVHRPDRPEVVSVDDVLRVANKAAIKVDQILSAVIKTI